MHQEYIFSHRFRSGFVTKCVRGKLRKNSSVFRAFWNLELWLKEWGLGFSSLWAWLKVPSWMALLWGGERKVGKPSMYCAPTVCTAHIRLSCPCNPIKGLGWTLPSGERSGESDQKAESRPANVFTQCPEQVGGPSANLSQLPLQADRVERREGGLERLGGEEQSPSASVSAERSHLFPLAVETEAFPQVEWSRRAGLGPPFLLSLAWPWAKRAFPSLHSHGNNEKCSPRKRAGS